MKFSYEISKLSTSKKLFHCRCHCRSGPSLLPAFSPPPVVHLGKALTDRQIEKIDNTLTPPKKWMKEGGKAADDR